MKRNREVRVEVHGWEGTGRNAKEAKAEAVARIESVAKGYFSPQVIDWRDLHGVVFRGREGWSYLIIRHGEDNRQACTIFEGDKVKAERACRRHMAQIAWQHADEDAVPEVLEGCTEEEKKDQVRWQLWQLDCQRLLAEGLSDWEAHRLAESRPIARPGSEVAA